MTNPLTSLYYRLFRGKPIIVISGLPRSGTSMLMQMLDAGGVPVGADHIRSKDVDNPKGYFELEKVKDLDKKGADKSWLKLYRGKVVKIISFLLRDLPRQFNYRIIFIERDIDEILISQRKMLVRRGENPDEISDEKIKKNYEGHLSQVKFMLRRAQNMEALYVTFKGMQDRPREEARRINSFLGGHLDENAMASVVDGSLYRSRPGKSA